MPDFLFGSGSAGLGQIEPHRESVPKAVEEALLAILVAPWKDWVQYPEVDWRAFHFPWIYSTDHDLFVRPQSPPSADRLSWELKIFTDWNSEPVELKVPYELPLRDEVSDAANWLNDTSWTKFALARRSVLFETPVAHFLSRGFASGRIDPFLSHITTIEAAL